MRNPFAGIINRFSSGALGADSPSVIGLDIGATSAKVVQIRKKKGRAVLETYGEIYLGPYAGLSVGQAVNLDAEKITKAVTDLFTEAKITSKDSAVAIPLSASLVNLIEMPAPEKGVLAEMIPIEARKYVPVPITEVALDWWVIPRKDERIGTGVGPKKVDVLLVAIHNSLIAKYTTFARSLGLSGAVFEIETFSTIRAVAATELSPVLIIDFGAGSSKISVVDYGVVRISHSIPRGSQEITLALSKARSVTFAEAEELKRAITGEELLQVAQSTVDLVLFEANRVLGNYQKRYNRTVTKTIITGGGSLLPGFTEKAKEKIGTDIVHGDPFSRLETPAFMQGSLTKAGPEFAVAVGLALRKLAELE